MSDFSLALKEMELNVGLVVKNVSLLAQSVNAISERMDILEDKLDKRIQLSSIHANLINKAIREKVKYISEKYSLNYKTHSKKVFGCIYRALWDRFGVSNYREIPDVCYENALEFIRAWEDEVFLKRINDEVVA